MEKTIKTKKDALFVIDRTKKGGDALYELLKHSDYAKLVTLKTEKQPTTSFLRSIEEMKSGQTNRLKNSQDPLAEILQ